MQDRRELIKAIVEAVGPLIDTKNETLKTVLMAEIKAMREESKQAHTDIMDKLVESNEINGKHINQLEKRVSHLEEESKFLPHSH